MQIIDIAIKDLRQIFRDWKSFLFLLIMPVAFTLLIGMAFSVTTGEGESRINLGVISSADPDEETDMLFDLLSESKVVEYSMLEDINVIDAETLVADDSYGGILVIPKGYRSSYTTQNLTLQLIVVSNTTVGMTVQNEVQRISNRIHQVQHAARNGVDLISLIDADVASDISRQGELFSNLTVSMLDAWDSPPLKVSTLPLNAKAEPEADDNYNSYIHASAGITVQFALAGLTTATGLLVAERRSRTLQRMLTAPVNKAQILGGHFLAIFVMVFTQLLILILFGAMVLGVPYANAPLATLIMLVIISLFTAAFGMMVGAISKDEEQAVLFTIMPMMVLSGLGGAWMPLETTSETFRFIGHFTPVAWAVDGLKNITERGLGLESILLPVLVLLAFTIVSMVLAVKLFRTE